MLTYPGKDLYSKVDKIVSKAFYTDYLYCDDNWYSVDRITLDYVSCDSDNETPIITVEISYIVSYSEELRHFAVDLFLDRSDDLNSGIVLAAFERSEEEN